MNEYLFVSIIMPVRDEADYILKSINSVRAQRYPKSRMEILVCDGMSVDATRDIVRTLMREDPRIVLIDNEQLTAPAGLNKGLFRAKGDVIIRVDGHCELPPDYVANCVSLLNKSKVDCVGGVIETVGATEVASVIASAQSSLMGVGNSRFRTGVKSGQYVDTLAFGAYRRSVFEKIGVFDEELVRNQDDEFNARLIQSGGRIWLDPKLHTTYYSRCSLANLWKQYYQYGYYKVRVTQKRGGIISIRSTIPSLMITIGIICFFTGTVLQFWHPLAVFAGVYLSAIIGASIINRNVKLINKHLLALALMTLHFSYGLGSLSGLLAFRKLWRWT